MRIVEDEGGHRYALVKTADEASLVRDVESGAEEYISNTELTHVDGIAPLEATALHVPAAVRRLLVTVHSEWGLGLLLELDRNGPLSVRDMADRVTVCESDLHGALAEFETAGLIEEVDAAGDRGYVLTETAVSGLDRLKAT